MYQAGRPAPLPLDERESDDRARAMRYRHLKRIAEREARAARWAHDTCGVERALWESLDPRERTRWEALSSLLEDAGG